MNDSNEKKPATYYNMSRGEQESWDLARTIELAARKIRKRLERNQWQRDKRKRDGKDSET